ncbi:MAG: urea ABC transporter permease subunit UrtC [Waterburya sp.]
MSNETGIQIKQRKRRNRLIEIAVIIASVIILAVILPSIIPAFRLRLIGRFLSLAIVALGIDLIWGYTGLLSLGHGIFFALGGYALAMNLKLQTTGGELPDFFTLYGVKELPWVWQPFNSFPFTIIALIIIPGIVAGLIGYLVFRNRIKGVYFSILTQAALLVFFNFFNGQQKIINGTNGLKTDTEKIFDIVVSSPGVQRTFYIITVICLVLIYLLCRWLTSGRFGRLLKAIRDDETRVRFSGYDPTGYKVLVFAISGAIAGIAGALYTVQTGIITPSIMQVAFSIEMVIWVAVGGRGTLVGAIIGTLLVRLAQTFLSESFPEIWLFFQGALFLIVVTVLPDGIIGWWTNYGWIKLRSLFGDNQLVTYPSLVEDPDTQQEKDQISGN